MFGFVHAAFNVTGDRSELAQFEAMMFRPITDKELQAAGGYAPCDLVFDFNGIIPGPPAARLQNPEMWAVDQWGVQCNARDLSILVDLAKEYIWFQFSTIWNFPEPVFEALAAEFPTLVFDGSAYWDNDDRDLVGQFNGDNNWGPGKIEWITCDEDEDASDED